PRKKPGAGYARPSRRGSNMTLSIPLQPFPVFCQIKMAKVVPSGSGRLTEHTYCADCRSQTSQAKECPTCGVIEDTFKGFDWEGKVVEVDTKSLEAEKDKILTVTALLARGEIDPLRIQDSYELWPEDDVQQAAVFDQLAAA